MHKLDIKLGRTPNTHPTPSIRQNLVGREENSGGSTGRFFLIFDPRGMSGGDAPQHLLKGSTKFCIGKIIMLFF